MLELQLLEAPRGRRYRAPITHDKLGGDTDHAVAEAEARRAEVGDEPADEHLPTNRDAELGDRSGSRRTRARTSRGGAHCCERDVEVAQSEARRVEAHAVAELQVLAVATRLR